MQTVSGSPGGRLGGIRMQVIGLVLLVALPLIVLSLLRIMAERTETRREADDETRRVTRRIAARVDQRIRTADALLLGLSAEFSSGEPIRVHTDSVLARTLRWSGGQYANIYVTDAAGIITASASAAPGTSRGQSRSDRGYFQAARTASRYVVSEPIRSRSLPDSAWVVVVARPLHTPDERFSGIVALTMRLDSLADVVSTADLSSDALVTILDTSGIVVARSADGAKYRGVKQVKLAAMPDTLSVSRITGFDKRIRVTGFVRAASAPWIVNVGILESSIIAADRDRLRSDLLAFLACTFVAIMIAFRMSQRIIQPITQLTGDARALTRGITGHRATTGGPVEIQALGDAFNQMAETVERRNTALADSERRYRLLFDSNPLPMWAWDADTQTLLAVNEAAIEHYGYDRDTFLTLQIVDLLDPSEQQRFRESRLPFSEARQGAGVWRHRKADGSVVEMEVVTTSSRRLGRASWLSVGIDVTARRAAERALAASEDQLRQSQKMEAIGAFAGGIAHDFNNLLTGMLGYCDLALGEMTPQHAVYADVSEIRALALRAADLTRQILVVSRKQVVQPAYIDPNGVVRGLQRLLARVLGEHIALTTGLAEHVGAVFADAGQLEQVLLNLAANARDAMPLGGTLDIRTRVVSGGAANELGVDGARAWVDVSVRDSGSGMSDDVRNRIFEPFFTTKERGKGTGLGLALAFGMMGQAGGTIHVDTAPGRGSTFHLLLPRHDHSVTPAIDTAGDHRSQLRGSETILLAEDEDSVRAVAVATLVARGYHVLAAASGEAALELARDYPKRIDLLLTDIVMPGINGRELAEALLRDRPDVRVLFASGYTDDESLRQGVRVDELSFLQKPFTSSELVRRVRSLLDAGVRAG